MKIGITCYPTYGGSGVIATELGKELALRGHEVHFISYALPFYQRILTVWANRLKFLKTKELNGSILMLWMEILYRAFPLVCR